MMFLLRRFLLVFYICIGLKTADLVIQNEIWAQKSISSMSLNLDSLKRLLTAVFLMISTTFKDLQTQWILKALPVNPFCS